MNCEQYEKFLSLLVDGETSHITIEQLQQHLQKCEKCCSTQQTFTQLHSLYSKPSYPFDSSGFVDKVMHEIRPRRSRGMYKKIAAALILMSAGLAGSLITYFSVSLEDSPVEEPLTTLTKYSHQENPWKLLREGITCKQKNPTKAKYLFVEARNRTEDTEVFAVACYQLAVISYYKEDNALYALSQLCQLIESIEANDVANPLYIEMGLHLAKEIYLSLPAKDILKPVVRQVIEKYENSSMANKREQPVIMIGDSHEK